MRKIIALFIVTVIILFCCGLALASGKDIMSRATVEADGDLSRVSGSTYLLWGSASGTSGDSLSISVKVYKGGSYITEISGSGSGPFLYKSRNVTLSSGTYTLKITATSSTSTDSLTKNVVI